jgi:hypothetical protein
MGLRGIADFQLPIAELGFGSGNHLKHATKRESAIINWQLAIVYG